MLREIYLKKEKSDFRTFSKKFWFIYLIFTLLILVPIGIFCLVFKGNLYDVGTWANLITGIFTYIGSVFLGMFVFYFSWKQEINQKNHNQPKICFDIIKSGNYKINNIFPFFELNEINLTDNCSIAVSNEEKNEEDYLYFCLRFQNLSDNLIKDIKLIDFYNKPDKEIIKTTIKMSLERLNFPLNFPLKYKETVSFYTGISKKELEKYNENKVERDTSFIFIFRIIDEHDKRFYIFTRFSFGGGVLIDSRYINYQENKIPNEVTSFFRLKNF